MYVLCVHVDDISRPVSRLVGRGAVMDEVRAYRPAGDV